MATADEIRRAREQTSIFSSLFDYIRDREEQLASEGRRPVLGGLLSKEPVMGTDTLRYEGVLPLVAGLLEPIARGVDAPRAAAQGLIPQEDMVGEALGTAGTAMVGGGVAAKPAGSLGANTLRVYHGGPKRLSASEVEMRFDPEGTPIGFSVTDNPDVAEYYRNMRGGGSISEFDIDLDKANIISERELYEFIDDLENKLDADASYEQIQRGLLDAGIDAIEYPDPEFGIRVVNPNILGANASKSAGLLSVASDVSARGDQILNMLKSGRGSEVTDAMLDMGDGVKNTQLNQYLAANYDLPMDEASRLARAREMGLLDAAYHSTGRDFQNFVPSEFRGASFFAATPEGASKGASASANEGVGSGSKITMPVRVDTSGVEGIGAYARKDMNEFRASLPDRIYTEAEVDALMASDAAPLRGNWSDFFDDLTDYDALRKFRDENPTKEIPDGIVKFRPKRPKSYNKDLKTDLSGRQFAHYSEGMSERPTSEYVKSQGNTGFTMMDESGLALAMVDPTKVRSQFARFDPRLSHLSNITAANASKGTGAMTLWHGSPYDFNEFDLSKIGTGEGAQDLGRGFSLTDYEANAHLYTNPASRWGDLAAMERYRQAGQGRYYQVNVGAAPEQFLDWNKPWRDQVPEATPLYDALAKKEAVMLSQYADDPAMQAAIPRGKISNMWSDNAGLEDAALQSGFVGNSRRNYSGDTEYTVFDPSLLRIAQKFDADGNVVSANASPISGLLAQSGMSDKQADKIEQYLNKLGLLQ